ncbi:acyl carrier protein [Streptomyces sp. NPDC049555]|uniref:acyl carrier protein n=1 Tax=Streptomyces sp. NPDC049555 TaxID=3154930 RepID=UPI00342D02E4
MHAIQQLTDVLTSTFRVPAQEVTPEATLDDLGLDSIGVVELFMTLQDTYGVTLDDTHATPDMTVRDVTALLQERSAASQTLPDGEADAAQSPHPGPR